MLLLYNMCVCMHEHVYLLMCMQYSYDTMHAVNTSLLNMHTIRL